MVVEATGEVVATIGTAYVHRPTGLGEPLAHPSRGALGLVLDDEYRLLGHDGEATARGQITGSIRSRSKAET
jgi:hypothetical protein